VARDRQRAKQRKQRQSPQPPSRKDQGNGRADDPASARADEAADAATTRADEVAAGRADQGDGLAPETDHLHRANSPGPWEHGGEVDRFEAELIAGAGGEPAGEPDAVERAARGDDDFAGDPPTDGDPVTTTGVAATAAGAAEPARGRGGTRFGNFLRACWAELQRVQWPDRRQVGQATMVVLGFLVIAGAFLGLADFVAERVVDLII
jgi:preprotein translocase subunit SecE